MRRERQKVYMVQRVGWYYNDEQDLPTGATLVRAFRTREAAQASMEALAGRIDPNSGDNPFPLTIRRSGRPLGELEPSLIAILDEARLPHPPVPTHVVASGHIWTDEAWWARCREQLDRARDADPRAYWTFWNFFDTDGSERFEVVETFLD